MVAAGLAGMARRSRESGCSLRRPCSGLEQLVRRFLQLLEAPPERAAGRVPPPAAAGSRRSAASTWSRASGSTLVPNSSQRRLGGVNQGVGAVAQVGPLLLLLVVGAVAASASAMKRSISSCGQARGGLHLHPLLAPGAQVLGRRRATMPFGVDVERRPRSGAPRAAPAGCRSAGSGPGSCCRRPSRARPAARGCSRRAGCRPRW